MKKTLIALILALAIFAVSATCFAADHSDVNTADALNELGLIIGTGNGYELDRGMTRAEGVTLLVRMIGMEDVAESGVYQNDFTDVPIWASGYIGYAFEKGITNGTGATTFSPEDAMTDYMFLTLVLRALDYSDDGDAPLFVWDNPYGLARELNLVENARADSDFTRADAMGIFWNALNTKLNGSEMTLADRLMEQEVFTANELETARDVQKNGRDENVGVPVIPAPETDAPETDTPETDASGIDAPETDAPEIDAPETETPEINESETNEPETETPEINESETNASETETPEINESEMNVPETDTSETGENDGIGGDQELERD